MRNVSAKVLFYLLLLSILIPITHAQSQIQAWRKKFISPALTVGINPLNPNTVLAEGANDSLYVSYDRGNTWTSQGRPGLFAIRQIVVHPSDSTTIFAADAGGGLRKSTDYGRSWRTVIPNYGIDGESITYDPVHPDTMYAGNFVAGKVYRSTDRGETWVLEGYAGSELCAFIVRADSGNILYGGTGGGMISKSTDFGATWRVVKPPVTTSVYQEVPKIVVGKNNPLIAYATINGDPDEGLGVWKTTDGGEHWTQTNAPIIQTWGMVIDDANDSVVYAGTFTDNVSTVYKTTDGGATWVSLGDGIPSRGYLWSLKLHPLDPTVVWASITNDVFGLGGIYRYRLIPSTTILQGTVFDAATLDTVKNGFVILPATGDPIRLTISDGTYEFGYFEGDPLTPTVHVEAYPFYVQDVQGTFVLDSTVRQDIYLQQLPKRSISGTLTDSLNHPVKANVVLTGKTNAGTVTASDSTDTNGSFMLPEVYISQPPIIQDYSLFVGPIFPYAQLQVTSLHLDTAGLFLPLQTKIADVFVVGEDSNDYGKYYATALDSLHLTPRLWNTITEGIAPFERGNEFNKKTVIYFSGTKHTPMQPEELANLVGCVTGGANMLLTGQDIAEKNDTSDLFKNYLGIQYGGTGTVVYTKGLAGDLFQGYGFYTTGPEGANNQTSRDILAITNPRARAIMGGWPAR
ncbi:MAG: hypothetical protein HY277_04555 [Ignavibacteriales bacterium]|nr:hypothetical protein [Ignavibacteriales bacterium]